MNKRNCVPRVLIVDDDPSERETTKRNLQPLKYELYASEGTGSALLEDARRKACKLRCHVAVVDMRLLDPERDDRSGLELIPQLAPTKCVVLTAYPSYDAAVQAIRRAGAFDFMSKAEGPQRLRKAVEEAVTAECHCWLSVDWPEGWSPQRVVKALGLQETGAPQDEPLCLFGQLFSEDDHLLLQTIEGQVRTPISSSSRARSVVFKAREKRADLPLYDEPVVVKIAPRQNIVREINNYNTFVRGRIPNYHMTRLERDRQTWDLGGIVYTFMGSSVDQMKRFDQYYRLERESSQILKVLHELFRTTLRNWFESAPSPSVRELFSLHAETLGLGARLQEYPNRKERIALPGLPFKLHNPIVWAEKHARASIFPDVRVCTTHGDLHAGNVLVDKRGEPWLIDFEWTGEGHILRDAVELEADIKFRLLELHPSEETHLTYALEVSLLRPESVTNDPQPPAEIQNHSELHKAYSVVAGLRQVAHEVTGFRDMREYYWALLCDSLFVATHEQLPEKTQERALLSAALICERLAQWREPWPPKEWLPITRNQESIRLINNKSAKKKGATTMLPPEQQAALAVLTEATKFLFSELGKRLDFWRKRKGEKTPQTIEPKPGPGAPVMNLDDLEQAVNTEALYQMRGSIETSLDILRKLTKELDGHRKQLLTDTLLDPRTRTYLENRIPELGKYIDEEANRLQELLDRVYGKQ